MTDNILTGLNAALEVGIFDQLRVIADRLEETGSEELAKGYRYLADQKLMPLRYEERWHWREHMETILPLGHQLPREATLCLCNHMPTVIGFKWNEAGSMTEAYRRAAQAIVLATCAEKLGDAIRAQPMNPADSGDIRQLIQPALDDLWETEKLDYETANSQDRDDDIPF